MATFVVVHGAWGGGWSWRRTVAPLLQLAGHEAFTPTLTGLGERAHLAGPRVDLETHIQDVLGLLEFEDLRDVILVGHSYGGMVITGVADRAGERLKQLVYLDAMVPQDGQALADLIGPNARAEMEARARDVGQGWQLPPGPMAADTPEAMKGFAGPRRRPQPLLTFTQPIHLTDGGALDLPRLYVLCTVPGGETFMRIAAGLRDDPAWRVEEFATGHNLNYTMPRELADLLLELV